MFDFVPTAISVSDILNLSIFILSIGLSIQGLEDIIYRDSFTVHPLLSWTIDRTVYREDSIAQNILDFVFSQKNFFFILLFRLIVPILCIALFLIHRDIPLILIALLFYVYNSEWISLEARP